MINLRMVQLLLGETRPGLKALAIVGHQHLCGAWRSYLYPRVLAVMMMLEELVINPKIKQHGKWLTLQMCKIDTDDY